MDRKDKKKKNKNQKKLDLKRRYKERHPEEFSSSSSSEKKEKHLEELSSSSSDEEEKHYSQRAFPSELENEMLRLFMSDTSTSIDVHSDLMSYFDRFELYRDKLNQIDPIRRDVHIATVRSIIAKDDIHFFELLCCDMVMCYSPRQFTKNERQKCYDLLVRDLHKHYPFCKIVDGNILNGNVIQNGEDITPLMYTFMIRVKYLDSYHPMNLNEVVYSDISILLEMLDRM